MIRLETRQKYSSERHLVGRGVYCLATDRKYNEKTV